MSEKGLEERLQQLLSQRGQELVRGLVDEIAVVHRELAVLRRELAALEEYRSMRDRWLSLESTAKTIRLPGFVAIEAHQPLKAADGFYAPELTEEGVVFRWTGPSPQFSFNVYIDRSQGADLRLETLSCIDPELQRKVSLFVDGESVALDVSASGDGFIATAELPKSAEAGATTLTFALPAALPPHGGDDSRQLGTAFRRLLLGARSETGMHTALIAAIAAAEPARAA